MTDPIFQSAEHSLTQLIDTAIETVQAEQNSGRAVVMALDYLREIRAKHLISQCKPIHTHEPHMTHPPSAFNTDK